MGEMFINVNGEPRRVSNIYANIDGDWRSTTVFANIDGSFTMIDDFCITEEMITGFKIIYVSDHDAIHTALPNLRYNPNIPASLSLTGQSSEMDTEHKGVIFQYTNDNEPDQISNNEQEGILKYQARIYAILRTGLIIDVTSANDDMVQPRSTEKYNSNRLGNLDIKICMKIGYVVNGIHTDGWNSLFDTSNHIGNLSQGHEFEQAESPAEYISIFPSSNRKDSFSEVAEIGIARDLHTPDKNMIGSHGNFTHDYSEILVDGVSKPFSIEIYH